MQGVWCTAHRISRLSCICNVHQLPVRGSKRHRGSTICKHKNMHFELSSSSPVLILTWIQKVQETGKMLALLAAGPSSATAKMVYGPTSECILKNVMPTWWYCIAWLFDQMMIKLCFWIDLWALRTITSSNCCTQTAWFKLLKLAQCEHYLYSEI